MRILNLLIVVLCLILSSCNDKRSSTDFSKEIEVLLKDQKFDQAKSLSIKFLKKFPSSSYAFLYKGVLEANQRDGVNAMLSFKKSIDLLPTNFNAFIERAKFKIVLEDYYGALLDIEKAEQIKMDNPQIYLAKGLVYEYMNNLDDAINAYNEAIRLGVKNDDVCYKLGCLYIQKGDLTNAYKFLREAGDLGNMNAFNIIKENLAHSNNGEFARNSVFKSFPGRFSMSYPSNLTFETITDIEYFDFVYMGINDDILTIMYEATPETMVRITNHSSNIEEVYFNVESIHSVNQVYILNAVRYFFRDYTINRIEKRIINGLDVYYLNYDTKVRFPNTQEDVTKHYQTYIFTNPKTRKVYQFVGVSMKMEPILFESTFNKIFKTFKFN